MTLVDDLEFRFMNREGKDGITHFIYRRVCNLRLNKMQITAGILVGAVCHRTDFRAEISRKFLKEIHQMVEVRYCSTRRNLPV